MVVNCVGQAGSLPHNLQPDKHYFRWVEYACVLAGELEMSGAAVDAERRNVVASRVANIQEIAIRLDAEIAGIIPLRPKVLTPRSGSVGRIDRQQADRVVKP